MNLLLVDDEAFALEALEHAIDWKSLGIDQVFSCGNIRKAEQICEESDIQILICDIEMPNGTGLDLARWLSEHHPDILILFLTCHSDFSFAKEAISYHAFAYLLKPFDTEEIRQSITDAIRQIENRRKLNHTLLTSSQPAERLLASEHFWLQLVNGSYQNSDAEYILWDAARNHVFFDKDASYAPNLFYIVSLPSEDTDLGVLSYCIKNALNELFMPNPSWPPAIELKPCFFLSFISPELFSDKDLYQKHCNDLFAFFRQKFGASLQMLSGSEGDYLSLQKQSDFLLEQAAASIEPACDADDTEKSARIVRKILELIKENKSLTREELAAQVFLSPDYMAKIFKKETGKRISDYLSEVRLQEAKYRLTETGQSISEIAASLSYSNFSGFSRMFKSETGLSPAEYRKKYRKSS
ncbi:MAG: response regulator [Lachnospiraceae bacterium]|nr:response regulator [Lachnospiraceae bacterium]